MQDTRRLIRNAAGQSVEVIGSLTDIADCKRIKLALQEKTEEQHLLIGKLQKAQRQLLQSEKVASISLKRLHRT